MTLHEAIEKLLRQGGGSMTTSKIADALNKNKWYQKKDGSLITAFQIHGRTRQYPKLFIRNGTTISLVGTSKTKVTTKSEVIQPHNDERNTIKNQLLTSLQIEKTLLIEKNFKNPGSLDLDVPHCCGIYCIRLIDKAKLPAPFNRLLMERGHNIIYIGSASTSLNTRFLNQELRANGHGTFFRSIGAVLGYKPAKGSLREKKNKRNYKFRSEDEKKIIEWINKNLLVNWIPTNRVEEIETFLIKKYKPLLNLAKNPSPLSELKDLRAECVRTANSLM
jgi:hypothetical protein